MCIDVVYGIKRVCCAVYKLCQKYFLNQYLEDIHWISLLHRPYSTGEEPLVKRIRKILRDYPRKKIWPRNIDDVAEETAGVSQLAWLFLYEQRADYTVICRRYMCSNITPDTASGYMLHTNNGEAVSFLRVWNTWYCHNAFDSVIMQRLLYAHQ